jgi:hypothetical protein
MESLSTSGSRRMKKVRAGRELSPPCRLSRPNPPPTRTLPVRAKLSIKPAPIGSAPAIGATGRLGRSAPVAGGRPENETACQHSSTHGFGSTVAKRDRICPLISKSERSRCDPLRSAYEVKAVVLRTSRRPILNRTGRSNFAVNAQRWFGSFAVVGLSECAAHHRTEWR